MRLKSGHVGVKHSAMMEVGPPRSEQQQHVMDADRRRRIAVGFARGAVLLAVPLVLLACLLIATSGDVFAQSKPVSVYWDHSTQVNSSGTDSHIELKMPDNIGEGDMILVIVNAHYQFNNTIGFGDLPKGFREVGAPIMDGTQSSAIMGAFWKIADATEPEFYDFYLNQPANAWEAVVVRVVGAHRVIPFSLDEAEYYSSRALAYNASNNYAGHPNTSITVPSIPTVPNSIVVAAMTVGASVDAAGNGLYLTPPFFPPVGMVEVRNNGADTGWYYQFPDGQHNQRPAFAVAIEDRPDGGDTGDRLFLIDQNLNRRLAFMFNIQPHYAMGFKRPMTTPLNGNTLPLNGVTTVEAVVVDRLPFTENSEPVSGVRVTFESSNPEKLQIIGPNEVWTDGLGRARIFVGNVDWEPGEVTITAKISKEDVNVERDDEVELVIHIGDEQVVEPPDRGSSSVNASPLGIEPTILYANGIDASTITVTARDANHNLVANTLIFLEITDGSGMLSETWGVTDEHGTFTARLTSLADGFVKVTAYLGIDGTAEEVIDSVSVRFTAAPPSLNSVSPEEGSRDSTVLVALTGENFLVDSQVEVSGAGITVQDVVVESATRITAYFIIDGDADLGPRDVTVTTAGGVTEERSFTVKTPSPPPPPDPNTEQFDTACTVSNPCIFTVPENVFQITVEGWGGGGGGGGRPSAGNTSAIARGGGGGGYARRTISVVPGQQFEVVVGSGGKGGPPGGGGSAGGNSAFRGPIGPLSELHLHAIGGIGGSPSASGNGGTGGVANVGEVTYSGGMGFAGGGGGAGTAGPGGDASGSTGGTGGEGNPNGGSGAAAPGSSGQTGARGENYGGGGAGGRRGSGSGGTATGGDGGDGSIWVSYETLQYGLVRVSGNGQEEPVTKTLEPFVVKVIDHNNEPVQDQTVTFRVVEYPTHSTGYEFSDVSVVTGPDGQASTEFTLGSRPGQYMVFAMLLDPNGDEWVPMTFRATATLGAPDQVEADVSVDGAVADGVDHVQFTVTVRDPGGYPVPDVTVRVIDEGGLNDLTDQQLQTNESGQAHFTATSTVAGEFTAAFGVDDVDQDEATATFIAGPPAELVIIQQPEGAVNNKAFTQQPVVQVQDAHGNVVKQKDIEITAVLLIADPDNEGEYIPAPEDEAMLGGTDEVTTDDEGLAKFTDLQISGELGTYYLRFASGELTPARSDAIELLPDNRPPVANFKWSHEFPRFGELVDFENLSDDPDEGDELSYHWDFGDGGRSTLEEPTHIYTQMGEYEVTLTVTDKGGLSHEKTETIHVRGDLRGYVYADYNWDGTKDVGEVGLGKLDPDLYVTLVQGEDIVASAPDLAEGHSFNRQSGEYTFSRLPVGDYEVVVTYPNPEVPVVPAVLAGWTLTEPDDDSPRTSFALNNAVSTVALGTKQGPSFGFAQGFVIQGTVFRDDGGTTGTPNDGRQSGDEAGLSGLRLRVVDAHDIPLGSALTDATGTYEFLSVGAGAAEPLTVRLVLTGTNLLATGYTPGTEADPVQYTSFTNVADVPLPVAQDEYRLESIDIGVVPRMHLTASATGSAPRGGFVFFPVRLQMGTRGSVEFDVSSPRGWDYTFYHDRNGNGAFDQGDDIVLATDVVGPGEVAFLMVVRVPTWENDGAVDAARVDVAFTYDGNVDLQETDSFFSLTTAQSSRLDLKAEVRNETAGGAFSSHHVEATTGDVLEYRLTYRNSGVSTLTDVIIFASVPEGTEFVPEDNGVAVMGTTVQFDAGDVEPNEGGSFTYRVKLQ